jgi:hypothetical protein
MNTSPGGSILQQQIHVQWLLTQALGILQLE